MQRPHLHDALVHGHLMNPEHAVVHQTARAHPAANDFIRRFDGRLAALASAHTLLSESRGRGPISRSTEAARALVIFIEGEAVYETVISAQLEQATSKLIT
jgi:hypothetical protein